MYMAVTRSRKTRPHDGDGKKKFLMYSVSVDEKAAVEKAGEMTDRTPANFLRWAVRGKLRELGLWPASGEEQDDV